jgi:hypothetical protein
MQKSVALSCLIMSLAVSATALADGRKDHEGERFSVPFFIENALANAPGALRADFTLRHPAILESFQVTCAGAPRGGLLYTDGGPLGVNGTTGVGATSDVGLVVGLVHRLPRCAQGGSVQRGGGVQESGIARGLRSLHRQAAE